MIDRDRHLASLRAALERNPIVAILGARQVGKTTIARELMATFDVATRFDLEDPDDLARLAEPKLALRERAGLIVIDEVQRRPDLFPILRVLADDPDFEARLLILGSASPDLLRQSSESLAGRIHYHYLRGFALDEVGIANLDRLWVRGGFPRSFLAESESASASWREDFITTFLERDLPQLGIRVPSTTLRRFWTMLAHYHAQTWNGAELARAFGMSATSVRRYLDILTDALVVFQLQPWHENLAKRQVKSPKVYISDSGLTHALLGIVDRDDLDRHPKVGATWEGFVIAELITRLGARSDEAFFWATHAGAELDLMVVRGQRRLGFEVKRTTSPRTTKSMHAANESLGLDHLWVVHAGEHSFPMSDDISALASSDILDELEPL